MDIISEGKNMMFAKKSSTPPNLFISPSHFLCSFAFFFENAFLKKKPIPEFTI